MALCTNSKGKSKQSNLPLHYLNNKIHRYSKDLGIIQGGDIQFSNGSGGESIWGKKFKDDPKGLKLKHDRKGVLSMGNGGKNSNTSQFFVTLKEEGSRKCDKKHVVLGQMIHGFDTLELLLEMVENAGGASKDEEVPPFDIVITGCGVWDSSTMPSQGYYTADDKFVEHTLSKAPNECVIAETKRSGGGAVVMKKEQDVTVKKGEIAAKHQNDDRGYELQQQLSRNLQQLDQGFGTRFADKNGDKDDDDDDDDFFGDQDIARSEFVASEKTQASVSKKLYNDGYRIGKSAEEDRLVQSGFDKGLEEGLRVGLVVGSFVAKIRHLLKDSTSLSTSSVDSPLVEYMTGKFIDDYHQDKDEAKTLLGDVWNSCFACNTESIQNDVNGDDEEEKRKAFAYLLENL